MKTIAFATNLTKFREARGFSKSELGRRIGVSDVSIGYWESGKSEPKMGSVQQLADALGVTLEELVYESSDKSNELPVNGVKVKPKSHLIPLYGSIAAGLPLEMLPVEEYIEIPEEIGKNHADGFLLKVNGDSMNRIIPNGAYALISPKSVENIKNGDVVAIQVNGYDATLKRFYRLQNTVVLEPDSYNPDHVAQNFSGAEMEDLRIIGKMVWYMSPPNADY
ncbi:helix-turn-helix domain-containing protein [Paenibacillus tritici]|uniref:helix-turn-helix domain-containing protein n=1 Tax=Paenibacillus tritici TaxID=1873425 RepID=UPI001BA7B284|nr:LexA family transcriptional regulator [Paenibacillus tritici]QUL57525.1 helix-turn-helix domain-containing protein [Paenibacillus tritici]